MDDSTDVDISDDPRSVNRALRYEDSDAYEALRKQPPPQFKHPSILRPYDGKNRASSTRNKPGSPGKC